jgi:hypothetical protein
VLRSLTTLLMLRPESMADVALRISSASASTMTGEPFIMCHPYGTGPPLKAPEDASSSFLRVMRSDLCSDSYLAHAPNVRATARPRRGA